MRQETKIQYYCAQQTQQESEQELKDTSYLPRRNKRISKAITSERTTNKKHTCNSKILMTKLQSKAREERMNKLEDRKKMTYEYERLTINETQQRSHTARRCELNRSQHRKAIQQRRNRAQSRGYISR
jgi:hypothetical protein